MEQQLLAGRLATDDILQVVAYRLSLINKIRRAGKERYLLTKIFSELYPLKSKIWDMEDGSISLSKEELEDLLGKIKEIEENCDIVAFDGYREYYRTYYAKKYKSYFDFANKRKEHHSLHNNKDK